MGFPDIASPTWSPPEGGRSRLQLERGSFHSLVLGPEDGPHVLCLHGFPDHPPNFEPLLAALAERGYRCYAPWLRGYAPSMTSGSFQLEDLCEDVLAMVRALASPHKVTLIGHDWGAVLTCLCAARAPDLIGRAITMAVPHPLQFIRGLVRRPSQLHRSSYMAYFQLPRFPERSLAEGDLLERLWRRWSPGLELDAKRMNALRARIRESLPGPLKYYRAALWPPRRALQRITSPAEPARSIAVPTLHLHGSDDGCIRPELGEGQSRFFRGPFASELIAGAGHFMQLEQPVPLAARCDRWIRETAEH